MSGFATQDVLFVFFFSTLRLSTLATHGRKLLLVCGYVCVACACAFICGSYIEGGHSEESKRYPPVPWLADHFLDDVIPVNRTHTHNTRIRDALQGHYCFSGGSDPAIRPLSPLPLSGGGRCVSVVG